MQWQNPRHVVEVQPFSLSWIHRLFRTAQKYSELSKAGRFPPRILEGRVMVTFFYEASTRTRISFEMAMLRLGGKVISTDNANSFSSAIKGETLEDTIRILADNRPDVIVLRHPEAGSALQAAEISSVPIINAGDGNNQHPTQAFTDFFTIQQLIRYDTTNPLKIAMVGDLQNGRTVRSLSYLLGKFADVVIYFVSPPSAGMKPGILDYLQRHGKQFHVTSNLAEVAKLVDVVYMTRIQKERGTCAEDFKSGDFILTQKIVDSMMKYAIIMHPFPRNEEIPKEIDADSRAYYFEQAENGCYIRMALLEMMLT